VFVVAFLWSNVARADTQLTTDDQGSQLGSAVASAGDVNGDGFADFVAGAPQFDTAVPDAREVFVFYGP
jgi:hypothetical protein